MFREKLLLPLAAVLLILFIGCSGATGDPVIPVNEQQQTVQSTGNTLCLGYWQVAVNAESGEVSITRSRSGDLILNVLGFLEPPAMSGLSIDFGTLEINPPILEVDVILKHPIPDPAFMGFDVRGIVFGPDVLNADGFTRLMMPNDFAGVPFGYVDGLLGVPHGHAHYGGQIAGYKYFCDGLGADDELNAFFSNEGNLADRGKFSSTPDKRRHYILSWEGMSSPIDYLVFNYAIYANYDWPIGEPPIGLASFEMTDANSHEAFCVRVEEVENTLYYYEGAGGGNITLDIEVWDWQGFDDYDVTIIADPDLGPYAIHHDAESAGTTSKSRIYSFTDVSGTVSSPGDVEITITAFDETETFGSSWFLGMLSPSHKLYDDYVFTAWKHVVTVAGCPPAVVTGITPDEALAGDAIDDAVITGTFMDGPSLAVKLKKTGEPDIVATDVIFVDANTITCDLLLVGAVEGSWDVEVTNGCGTPGTGVGLFEAIQSKNIDITYSGTAATDLAMDQLSGDVLVYYGPAGRVRRYTSASNYASYTQYSVVGHAQAERIASNANGDFLCTYWYGSSLRGYYYNSSGTPYSYTINHGFGTLSGLCDNVAFPDAGSMDNAMGAFINWHINATTHYLYGHIRYGPTFSSVYYPAQSVNPSAPPSQSYVKPDYAVGAEVDMSGNYIWWCVNTECYVTRFGNGYDYGFSYQGAYFGTPGTPGDDDSHLYKPQDMTCNDKNKFYILDALSTGDYVIKGFTESGGTTTPITGFGQASDWDYDPFRIDGDYLGRIATLQVNGTDSYISVFPAGEAGY